MTMSNLPASTWRTEIPWKNELPFSGLRLVVMVIRWRGGYAEGSSGASIGWRLGMHAYMANRCLQTWRKRNFRKACLRLKKPWLDLLRLAFLFGIVQFRKVCDKYHGGPCQFTRNTKSRFASFVSSFHNPTAQHACSAACISKTHQARRQYLGPRHGSIKAITWPWNSTLWNTHWCMSSCMITYCVCVCVC